MKSNYKRYKDSISRRQSSKRRQREKFAKERAKAKKVAIAKWYDQGGELFFQWVLKNYRLPTGDIPVWKDKFLPDLYRVLGSPYLERIVTQKSAQIGYTEVLVAVSAFFAAYLGCPVGVGFEERMKQQVMAGTRFQPAFTHCKAIEDIATDKHKATGKQDIDSKSSITIGGVPVSFFYANTKDESQAPAGQRSWPACIILADEFSLWRDGVLDGMIARMNNSPLISKMVRAGSTPSYEGSILDIEVKKARYCFEWEVVCPHCLRSQFADTFGNFLRPVLFTEDDATEIKYVSSNGKPLQWFHHSQNPKGVEDLHLSEAILDEGVGLSKEEKDRAKDAAIDTAYIGCRYCAGELTSEILDAGRFVCSRTGIGLTEFMAEITTEKRVVHHSVAMILPRVASHAFKASERIRTLLTTRNPTDEIQQQLGKAISLGSGKIGVDKMLACVGLALPCDRQPDLKILGLDQGRPNYAVAANIYFGEGKDKQAKIDNAHIQVFWWGGVNNFEELEDLVDRYDIDIVGLDNEPEYGKATDYAVKHLPFGVSVKQTKYLDGKIGSNFQQQLEVRGNSKKGQTYLFDQMQMKGTRYKRSLKIVANTRDTESEVPIHQIDRTTFLDEVAKAIVRHRFHLPPGLTFDAGDDSNFIKHFITSERTPDGTWKETPGTPDHFFHATNFVLAAMEVSLYETGLNKFSFTSVKAW